VEKLTRLKRTLVCVLHAVEYSGMEVGKEKSRRRGPQNAWGRGQERDT